MRVVTALISAAFFSAIAPAHAQQPTHGVPAIDCGKSMLSMNPPLTCMAARGVINDNRTGNKDYHISGVLNARSLFMVLSMPPFVGSIRPYSEQVSVNILKNFNDLTRRQGKDWSAIATDGNTSSMRFKTENQDCIAFDHAGPLKDGGYAWTLRGYLCAAAGTVPVTPEIVKAYLAATRVGTARDNLNAYGQSVRPLPRS